MDEEKHGIRLTRREFEDAIANLYQREADEEAIQRRELDLTIEYRLGTQFPADRREQLWQVHQRIEKYRLRLAAKWLAGVVVAKWRRRQGTRMAQVVINEYAKVLTPEELIMYFGSDEVGNPSLPS